MRIGGGGGCFTVEIFSVFLVSLLSCVLQVRIDEDLWVSRSEILDIGAKYTKLRPRTEAVTTLLIEDQPHLFGISGFTTSGEALLRFTPQMQEAVLSELLL